MPTTFRTRRLAEQEEVRVSSGATGRGVWARGLVTELGIGKLHSKELTHQRRADRPTNQFVAEATDRRAAEMAEHGLKLQVSKHDGTSAITTSNREDSSSSFVSFCEARKAGVKYNKAILSKRKTTFSPPHSPYLTALPIQA